MASQSSVRATYATKVSPYDALVLDGLGIPSSVSPQTIKVALADATTPIGAALLLACHQSLMQELRTLTTDEASASGIDPNAVPTPEALLELPKRYPHNSIVANIHLYLIQLLSYSRNASFDPPTTAAHADDADDVGILAFSTGMFAAVVIASSRTVPTFIVNAVEVFRAAFWLGLRVQHFATQGAGNAAPGGSPSSSWSLVIFGAQRSDVQEAVDRYNADRKNTEAPAVHLTAVTHAACISVSGHPDALSGFEKDYIPPAAISTRYAPIYALYHSPEMANVKAEILADIANRKIRFPLRTDLQRNIRSTVSGTCISASHSELPTLAEEILDMTLLHPVNFDLVLDTICAGVTPSRGTFRLVNIGPGNVLWRSVSRALSGFNFQMVDWSPAARGETSLLMPQSLQSILKQGPAQEPIAIVGMAVKFPGSEDANGLWDILKNGLNTVSEIPTSRFNVSDFTSGTHGPKRTLKTRFGNFLDSPDAFDNAFFHISPREARSMDPQQRILLEVSYHALESAGYVPGTTGSFDQETFATYVGVATNDYAQNLRDEVDVYYSTGTLQAFLSGKISYAFGFSGPSVVVDTACSSSMVAIYQACRSLNNKDCNAAIAGGVNVITSPDMYIGLDRGHFLSPTGQCKPWDASADGYCRSEGCGMFVLKRLADALAENDNILGVIRGVEMNQSANAESITHPHVPTQTKLFEKLLATTGIAPSDISVVEAHGTGTKAGDPTEIESIRGVFAQGRSHANPLHLTSIKANIGHAEAASGAASLAKLLLMMRHRTIPAVISLKNLNPRIRALAADGTRIDTETVPWDVSAGGVRLALLNNFGAAGSNAALILQEGPSQVAKRSGDSGPGFPLVVGISCESEAALERQRTAYVSQLQHPDLINDEAALQDFAYSATARRRTSRYRLVASGVTKEDVCASLRTARVVETHDSSEKVVFVFSGQGGQYLGMGAGLYRINAVFRTTVDRCHALLVSWGLPGVIDVIAPREDNQEQGIQAFQSAVFVLECALAEMWMSWGIKPDAVAGHSLGEYAAFVTAGVLSLEDGLKLVAGRAELMAEKCAANETGMLAVRLSPSRLEELIVQDAALDGISVACYNSCEDTVAAGPLSQLDDLQTALKSSGHKCARVNVPFAYHTSAMDPISDDIVRLAGTVKLSPPTLPIVSNVQGRLISPGDSTVFVPGYFAQHCAQPVKFEQGIQDLVSHKDFGTVSVWMEIGPHPTTLPMLRSIPSTSHQAVYLPSLKKNTEDGATLSTSLSALYCTALALNWREVFKVLAPAAQLVDLPAYPFEKTRYWVDYNEQRPTSETGATDASSTTRYTLVERCVSWPGVGSSDPALFETDIARLASLIEGHKVSDNALCPASVYVEAVSAAAQLTLEHFGRLQPDTAIVLSEISFHKPLVYTPEVSRVVRIEITLPSLPLDQHLGKFQVTSYVTGSMEVQTHCSGVFDFPSVQASESKMAQLSTMVQARIHATLNSDRHTPAETFYTRTAYDVIFSRIVEYAGAYQTMASITLDPNGVDAYAVMRVRADAAPGVYVVHPIFTDTLLHAAGFAVNCAAARGEAFICARVDKVRVLPARVRPGAEYGVYCSVGFVSEGLAVVDAYAVEIGGAARVVAHVKRMHFKKLRLAGFGKVLAAAGAGAADTSATRTTRQKKAAPPTRVAARSRHSKENAAVRPPVLEQVKKVVADVLGIPASNFSEADDLERLGMDSLTFIETWHTLRSTLNFEVSQEVLTSCRTVADIIAAISALSPAIGLDDDSTTSSESEDTLNDFDTDSRSESDAASAVGYTEGNGLLRMKQIVAEVLGVPVRALGEDESLERLGMDSLMSIEARHALCEGLGVHLPEDVFVQCKSVREVQSLLYTPPPSPPLLLLSQLSASSASLSPLAPRSERVEGKKGAMTFGTDVNPVKLQDGVEGGSALPLFLIHDGSGTAHQYSRLSSLGRPVWGIHNPKFASGERWEGGLLEMATHYAGLVRSVLSQNGSPECLVGGWSVGGVIAFEVARQLMVSGTDVAGLVLIDSPPPQTNTPLADDVLDAVFSSKSQGRSVALARRQMQHATAALVAYDPSASPARGALPSKTVMLRCADPYSVSRTHTKSQSDLFLAERSDSGAIVREWEELLGYEISVFDILGNHFQPFDYEYVQGTSQGLREAISSLSGN